MHFVFSSTSNSSAPTLFFYITGQALLFSHYIHYPLSLLQSTTVKVQYVTKKAKVIYSYHQWHANKWQLFQFLSLSDYNGPLIPAQCKHEYKKLAEWKLCVDQYYSADLTKILSCRKQHHVVGIIGVSCLVPLINNTQNTYQFEHYPCIYNKHSP